MPAAAAYAMADVLQAAAAGAAMGAAITMSQAFGDDAQALMAALPTTAVLVLYTNRAKPSVQRAQMWRVARNEIALSASVWVAYGMLAVYNVSWMVTVLALMASYVAFNYAGSIAMPPPRV